MGIMFEDEPIRLETLADGHAPILFDEQLRAVLANITDPNTHRPKPEQPKRTISIEVEVTPTINDWGITLELEVKGKPKLVAQRGARTMAQVTEKGGVQLAFEATGPQRQQAIDNVLEMKKGGSK